MKERLADTSRGEKRKELEGNKTVSRERPAIKAPRLDVFVCQLSWRFREGSKSEGARHSYRCKRDIVTFHVTESDVNCLLGIGLRVAFPSKDIHSSCDDNASTRF